MPPISVILWLIGLGAVFFGGYEVRGWRDDARMLAERTAQLEAQRKAVQDAVEEEKLQDALTLDVGKLVADGRTKIVTKTITLIKEVPKYVTPEAVAACVVPRGFVELHNLAASSPTVAPAAIPDATSGTVNANSNVGLDTVESTLVSNYGRCNQALEQNNVGWPQWYEKAKAIYDDWAKKQQR